MVSRSGVGTLWVVAGLLWMAAPAEAQTGFQVPVSQSHDRVRVGGFVWRSDVEGTVAVDDLSGVDDGIDLVETLGFGETSNGWILDVNLGAGRRHRFIFGASGLEQNASTVLDFDVEIGDTVVDISEEVASVLELREVRAFYNLLIVSRPSVEVGLMGGLGWFDVDATARSDVATAAASFQTPYPSAGLNVMLNPAGRVRAYGELSGFPEIDVEDLEGSLLDLHGRLEVFVIDNVGVAVGYRDYRIELANEVEGFSFDLEWSGLTFGALVRY